MLVSKALIDSQIYHDKFVLVKNMLREYNEVKGDIVKSYQILWNML